MSTYYAYQDVKVMMAHKLMNMDGWKVYGYHADNSDMMTDYYDPAYWGGIAEKNGYILVVDRSDEQKPQEIRQYNHDGIVENMSIREKIEKLSKMTVSRGASEAEEKTAKAAIEKLKAKEMESTADNYIVTGMIPGHMANPPRMNWHIEKDGIYIAKGNGILKFAKVDNYYNYPSYIEDMKLFRKDKDKWSEDWVQDCVLRGYYTEDRAREIVVNNIAEMEEKAKLIDQFEKFINKIDTTCGSLIGDGDGSYYEKVIVTEYKKENKVVEDESGSIKDGQCFVLKSNFSYGCNRGYVYRIHKTEYDGGQVRYHANKLNGKLTKECTGHANRCNYWYIGKLDNNNLDKWIDKGAITWCHIEEVKTPYEVEKVVKKTIRGTQTKKRTTGNTTSNVDSKDININKYTFCLSEDIDTRNNEKIYLVKIKEKLDREEYLKVNKLMKSIGGYYSRFKSAFLFRENPEDKLNCKSVDRETSCNEKNKKNQRQKENILV